MKSIESTCCLALIVSLSGCAAESMPGESWDEGQASEDVGTAEQAVLGSLHNQVFGGQTSKSMTQPLSEGATRS